MHVHGPVSRTFSTIKYCEGAADPSSLTDARIGGAGEGGPRSVRKTHNSCQDILVNVQRIKIKGKGKYYI